VDVTVLKKRDAECFEHAQREIAGLIEQAQAGEIELAYVDEAGFAPQPPNRSAWAEEGETHTVASKRSPRLNVIAVPCCRPVGYSWPSYGGTLRACGSLPFR
jgi:hypothetical protein